ncbi:M23 family metallopeptidase [Desmospora profundinema]|uniref:Murein DD-endopeptidase MepM/ murein hydrolase activator NlpD n=1 Tax=Desmospora profundinema TaxID=1571184 RepID=A0ABU1IRX9_9BACL|nr:M23 family metallopeptidase [Desmospora profundinema]MDR6227555.1 murein DD-endopeptidase MepM/ murein hydrolase activator NlpD [Desmospora profundinema]
MLRWMFRLLLLGAAGLAIYWVYDMSQGTEIPDMNVPGDLAAAYAEAEAEVGVPWPYLAAWHENGDGYESLDRRQILASAEEMRKAAGKGRLTDRDAERALHSLIPEADAEQVIALARSYRWAASPLAESYLFPFDADQNVDYGDTWGDSRTYGGSRPHEGTDLFAAKGTPIRSVSDGRIVSKGWNELGGWRLTIMDDEYPQISFYYAHLERYAEEIQTGTKVKKGQIIGYVGDSGYGPEGTTGQFAPHLHFGVYVRESTWSPMREAINPYAFLRAWEAAQADGKEG